MRARSWLLLTPVVIGGLALWALRGAGDATLVPPELDASRPRPQGDYWVGAVPEPTDLNPFTTQDAVARRAVLAYTHDALFELDPGNGQLRPALATAVESSTDGLTHTFTLRPDVRFADGQPLTHDDVLFTWQVAQDPSVVLGALGGALRRVADIVVLADGRLQITLREATAFGLGAVATGYLVCQRAWWQRALRSLTPGAVPEPGQPGFGALLGQVREPGPGSGPYQVGQLSDRSSAWRRGLDLTMVQNAYSWRRRDRPLAWNLAGIKLRFLADRSAQLVALRRGELDWLQDPQPAALLRAEPELAARCRALDYDYLALGHYAVLWNHRRPGLGHAAVRRALGMCFDREAIATGLMGGHATVARSWFKPGDPSLPPDLPPPVYDPEAANAALAAAGFTGRRLTLCHAASESLQRDIVELARPALARAGVELVTEGLEAKVLLARLQARDFDAVLAVINLDRWLDPSWHFHSAEAERGRNWMGYASAAADDLLVRGRQELDEGRRVVLYRQLARLWRDDEPMTLLVHPRVAVVVDRRFRGAEPGALGLVPELWWVEPGDQRY